MKIKFCIFFVFLFFTLIDKSFSQGEANIWYFGYKAGIDFTSGAPVVLTNGKDSTREGCSTICSSTGNLLFYTNGVTVWNNLHVPMPNGTGLMGNNSSTQSCIIIPKPGSSSIFYIFTTDAVPDGTGKGLRYSEVDLSLAGGVGDVTSSKNVLLNSSSAEKLTAVKHSNNSDIWVIGHAGYSSCDEFLVYSVTSSGINLTPVTSNEGSCSGTALGCLKASPDGKYLAQANSHGQNIDVLKFNNSTGLVTNFFSFSAPECSSFYGQLPYGVEFSPDCTRLYVSLSGFGCNNIYQYDMTLNTTAAIIASETIIGTATGTDGCGSIQIAPNGKIYIAKHQVPYLACINNPNALGVSCNFVNNAVNLLGRWSVLGLENVIQSYFNFRHISYINTCLGIATSFSISDTTMVDSVRWNFGDPMSGINNTSSLFEPNHIYSSSGIYNVSAISFYSTYSDTLSIVVNIHDVPVFSLGRDTSFCTTNSITLNPNSNYPFYQWQNGSTSSTIVVTTPGTYWVNVSNSCGLTSDTMTIFPIFTTNLRDTSICKENSNLTLNVPGAFQSYLWSDSSTSSSFTIHQAGTYWLRTTNICGNSFDTIHISEHNCNLIFPNIFTPNGDGVNDLFIIQGMEIGENSLIIYNRWGEIMYQSTNYNNDWNGNNANDGIYFYDFHTPVDGNDYRGFIQLLTN